MTKSLLDGDGALSAPTAGPALATAPLLGESMNDHSNDGTMEVLQEAATTSDTPPEPRSSVFRQHAVGKEPTSNDSSAQVNSTRQCQSTRARQWNQVEQANIERKRDVSAGGKLESVHAKRTENGRGRARHSRRFRVHVTCSMGQSYEIRVRSTDSVLRVKEKIGVVTDVFPAAMHLLYNGDRLADEHVTMGSLGVVEGSTLHLVPFLQSGQLEMVAGSSCGDGGVYERLYSDLTEKQLEDLAAGALHAPVSFVATVGGKRVLVRLRPTDDRAASTSLFGETDATAECATWAASGAQGGTTRRDAQWRRERQAEHKNMRMSMDSVRERLRTAKAERARRCAPPAIAEDTTNIVQADRQLATHSVPEMRMNCNANGKNGCHTCAVRLGLVAFPCKCGNMYCSAHRHNHECSYDYHYV